MTSILHDEQSDTRSLRWVIVQGATLTIALVALVFLVGSGLYISYENVHTFVSNHGKYGQHAQLAALGVDVLTLVGLFVSLFYRDVWARAAFVVGLVGTAIANGLVGWEASTYFGLAVALWPLMSMELSYRISLSLILPALSRGLRENSKPLQESSSPLQEDSNPLLETSQILQEDSQPLQERLEDSGMVLPTPENYLAVVLENSNSLPSRAEVIRATGCTEWQARKALEALKNG